MILDGVNEVDSVRNMHPVCQGHWLVLVDARQLRESQAGKLATLAPDTMPGERHPARPYLQPSR